LLVSWVGAPGGGAALTPAGHTVIEAFRRIEAEMVRALRTVESELAEAGVSPLDLVSGFLMKTSARNAIRGSIVKIVSDALSAEVEISVSLETTIFSLVTHAKHGRVWIVPGSIGDPADQGTSLFRCRARHHCHQLKSWVFVRLIEPPRIPSCGYLSALLASMRQVL
jgi:hypothetical protein